MWSFFLHRKSTTPKELPQPWQALRGTGNGIGGAPVSLQTYCDLDEKAFDGFYLDELFNHFCHQGTIYAATPFAVREVFTHIDRANAETADALVYWIHCCVFAESLGVLGPSRAGIWLPDKDLVQLHRVGIVRPLVCDVLREQAEKIIALSDKEFQEPAALSALRAVLDGKPVPEP